MEIKSVEDGPWWESGVLDPHAHEKLIRNRHAIGRRAGLGEDQLYHMNDAAGNIQATYSSTHHR
ncbi:MAG: hypothetical protein COB49_11010 [Alphaproteobacteria bacterium]|nr:MAG: hypothetical protein COB49_11010 [Alphaproteobacteria bacterium]